MSSNANYTDEEYSKIVNTKNANINSYKINSRMSPISVISLVTSLLAFIFYVIILADYSDFTVTIFVLLALLSVILPPISKAIRIKKGQTGKVLEIVALIIGSFDFYCIIFALTQEPLEYGYLGGLISVIAYCVIKSKPK